MTMRLIEPNIYGRTAVQGALHARNLHLGLFMLGDDFAAELCPICTGEGAYDQTYNAGCGMGYFKSYGPCDYCGGAGLRYPGSRSAIPESVVFQVIRAANAEQDYRN